MNRIRELRTERGLRGATLARMAGVPRQTLWRWETNQQDPNGRHLLTLASVLRVEPRELFANPPGILDENEQTRGGLS